MYLKMRLLGYHHANNQTFTPEKFTLSLNFSIINIQATLITFI